jgi:hypothetical protein
MSEEQADQVQAQAERVKSWADQYEELFGNPPARETILYPQDRDGYAKIKIDLQEGKEPFVYGLAFVPDVVGCDLGWFLVPEGEMYNFGIKCILMPRARKAIIDRFGVASGEARVKALRVMQKSQSGKSLQCEVAIW